ncbi:TPA: toll/interleukin-1 receptor domain-containing protein [Bacillus thuringiensis]|uniref:hypothetical protein n=1 Tax=Bacillus thuringiensis TaxID=1428 RepID=UPI00288D0B88|nr:toll/interleukin-1 receptor domain-containing protein [Bacillus thuringiensis]
MKVFLSWSGEVSRNVALIFRDWLPSVLQSVKPYVSSEDIDKGTRWSSDIAGELNDSNYGIIVVTKENIIAPWINFEAGALSKQIDKSNVSPFLFNLKRSEVAGPILQFQSTIYTKDDMKKLMNSINGACQSEALEQSRLDKVFEVWWPSLKKALDEIEVPMQEQPVEAIEEKMKDQGNVSSEILEELLELARNQQKILRSPSSILPPEYVREVVLPQEYVREVMKTGKIHPRAIPDLAENVKTMQFLINELQMKIEEGFPITREELIKVEKKLMTIDEVTEHLKRNVPSRLVETY